MNLPNLLNQTHVSKSLQLVEHTFLQHQHFYYETIEFYKFWSLFDKPNNKKENVIDKEKEINILKDFDLNQEFDYNTKYIFKQEF